MAPWQQYESRLAAAGAARLRGHAPNFLVIAPPKTATTWVYEVLSTDRRFFMPEKECRYFSHFWREYPLSSYYAQFQNPFGAGWRGEASPSYFILPSAAIAAIRQELPETKLIILLRDPGERLWSHARHSFMYKEAWFRSSTAWRIEEVSEIDWCQALLHPVIRAFDDYAEPLVRWAEHFPAEQVLVLASEMIGADPERAYSAIYQFLGLQLPIPHSPFLQNRPNPSPRVELPHVVAELLAKLTTSDRLRLEAALPGLPSGLADQLRAAMAYWQHRDRPAGLAAALPKPPGMGREPGWDQLTRTTFPRELLTWSYMSAEAPPNPELLHLAALNFEYSYFSAPSEKGMPQETLLRRVQTLGTSIIEHDARLSGIEGTATTLHERLSGLEHAVEPRSERLARDQRLMRLEQTIEERSARLSTLEGSSAAYSERLDAIETDNTKREERLVSLEQTFEERSARLSAVESEAAAYSERLDAIGTGNTQRDERLARFEQTLDERSGRLVALETELERDRSRIASIEATNAAWDERLHTLEQTGEERTGRLMVIAGEVAELRRQMIASDAELRVARERHEHVAGVAEEAKSKLAAVDALEVLIRQEADRVARVEHALAERNTESAAQNRKLVELQTVNGEIADLRATVEKALYAVALLQESLQGVGDELNQLRLSRNETDLSPVLAHDADKRNSTSLI